MGRRIIPIGLDIYTIKNVFGSKDQSLFNEIISSEFYRKFDEELSFKKELVDIIFNYVPHGQRTIKEPRLFGLIKGDTGRGLEGEWYDYGYALLTICCILGDKLSKDDSEFVYNDSWWQINTLLRANGCNVDLSRMFESQQVFDTPFEVSDIYTNFYNKKELTEFVTHLMIIEKDIDMENMVLFNVLRKGLSNCIEKNMDLIIFSYEI